MPYHFRDNRRKLNVGHFFIAFLKKNFLTSTFCQHKNMLLKSYWRTYSYTEFNFQSIETIPSYLGLTVFEIITKNWGNVIFSLHFSETLRVPGRYWWCGFKKKNTFNSIILTKISKYTKKNLNFFEFGTFGTFWPNFN